MPAPKDPIKYEEWKIKLSKLRKGKPSYRQGKTYEKLYGKEKAKEIKEVQSKAHLGKYHSEKTRNKMSEESKGKSWEEKYGKEKTDEMKTNLRKARLGKKLSEETKRKLRLINKDNIKGEKHFQWLGGKESNIYQPDFNKIFREKIRERDYHRCQLCNLFDGDCVQLYHRMLGVHHIDYDRANNLPQNCITICARCHGIIHTKSKNGLIQNKQYWITLFHSLLKEKYDYEYTQDQKIILDYVKVIK